MCRIQAHRPVPQTLLMPTGRVLVLVVQPLAAVTGTSVSLSNLENFDTPGAEARLVNDRRARFQRPEGQWQARSIDRTPSSSGCAHRIRAHWQSIATKRESTSHGSRARAAATECSVRSVPSNLGSGL
jgi:hypothetical protein